MTKSNTFLKIALIGGGPAALFMLKHLIEQEVPAHSVSIFERYDRLGVGMPYGKFGAEKEHVANVSANELPALADDFETYIQKYPDVEFDGFVKDGHVNPYEVIPRRLLGNFLEYSFSKYLDKAKAAGIAVNVHLDTLVEDLVPNQDGTFTILANNQKFPADTVVVCTGHVWPKQHEENVKGWFDSPYPPSKLALKADFPVAVRGASLTAVDAIKTLSRANGNFTEKNDGSLSYALSEGSENFRIDLLSLRGFLPSLRFHSEDDAFSAEWTMSLDEIHEYKAAHGGFVDLDYVFERCFKERLREKDPAFYEKIKEDSIEAFVERMLQIRKDLDSFLLFKAEFEEAEKSIHRQQSISWKETLSAFSYAVNYPAKHFSAEDMTRHKKTLMPLISIIIASLPQSSYHELMALHRAGLLQSVAVGQDSRVEPGENGGCVYTFTDEGGQKHEAHYGIFVDAIGQKPMLFNDLPFEGLKSGAVTSGYLYFREAEEGKIQEEKDAQNIGHDSTGHYYMKVPGLAINDYFQALDPYGAVQQGLYLMAVPFIGGLNPDYSGLDFCDTAGGRIAKNLKAQFGDTKNPG